MKKAFIITSVIDIENGAPLTYSNTRTHFSKEDRFKQTIFTIANLDALARNDSTFFIIDSSENYEEYRGVLGYQKNLVFVSVKQEFPEIFNTVRTHPNKSHCETLTLLKFFEKYKHQLEEYDYFFKISGRYFTDGSFDTSLFNEERINNLFFKKPLSYDWHESWDYKMVDRREIQGNNKIHQYSSVLYGFGKGYLDKMIDIYRGIVVFTDYVARLRYDVETLIYFFTREFEQDIIETDWVVYGWDGTNGTFLRY